MTDGPKTPRQILQAAIEKQPDSIARRKLPPGVTIHAIERATTLGSPRTIEGQLLVELPDGSLHRLTGPEMAEWNDALAPFVKSWK
jgi:hypothetical protein